MNTIITIGREYGSGGKDIGRALAEHYGIHYYDKDILKIAAEESGICEEMFKNYDEKPSRSFLYSLAIDPYSMGFGATNVEMPLDQKVFLAAFDTIKNIATKGPCVIVGRCADYALREMDNVFSVFTHAHREFKADRIHNVYGIPEDKCREVARKADKQRASYYNYYTSKKWGDAKSYDLVIDTGAVGIDGAVEIIKTAIAAKEAFHE